MNKTGRERSHFLRPEDIRRLDSFQFAPKAVVEGYLAGRHASHQQGASLEFRDYRPYVQGDDLALVDWRVYGRTDRHYLKTFEQETNMDGHILLDSSASMGFGSKLSKLEYGSFFAAALSYLILRGGDRVSLGLYDQELTRFMPSGSTTAHLHQLLNVLEKNEPTGKTSAADVLKRAFPLYKKRGTLVIISDFLDDVTPLFEALSPYLHKGFKLHLFQILTPEELDLKDRGLTSYEDLETGARIPAHPGRIAAAYRRCLDEHMEMIRSWAARRGVDYSLARTDQSFYHLFDRLAQCK